MDQIIIYCKYENIDINIKWYDVTQLIDCYEKIRCMWHGNVSQDVTSSRYKRLIELG